MRAKKPALSLGMEGESIGRFYEPAFALAAFLGTYSQPSQQIHVLLDTRPFLIVDE